MQFARHLSKGFWALSVQVVIAFYGIAIMFLVVRVLPEEEFGNYVLIQMAFMITANLGTAFAFAPLIRYVHEYEDRGILLTSSLFLGFAFFSTSGCIIWLFKNPLGSVLNSTGFTKLAFFLPALLASSFFKYFNHQLLRGLYRIKSIFLTELTYHTIAVALILGITFSTRLSSAFQMLMILVVANVVSSMVSFWLVRDQLSFAWRLDLGCIKTLFDYGKFTLGSSASGQVHERLDVFMIAAFAGPVEVAIFSSAKLFARIIEGYRQVTNLLAMPAFSKLNSEKKFDAIKATYEKGILFSHIILVPLCLLLIIFAEELYRVVYAEKYLDGVIILQLFAITGPLLAWQCLGEGLLNGLGFPKISFSAKTTAMVMKVILNLILISQFRSIGAVTAVIISTFILVYLLTRGVKSKISFSLYGIVGRFQDVINFIKMTKLRLRGLKF